MGAIPQMKQCTKCGETKPHTETFFPPVGKAGGKLRLVCRVCRAQQARGAYHNRPKTPKPPRHPTPPEGYKRCAHCREEKPIEMFSKSKERKDGLQKQCKICNQAYRDANRIQLRQASRNWRSRNLDRARQNNRRWCRANQDRIIAYREVNRDSLRAKGRAYRREHPEKARAWEAANRELVNHRARERRRLHPGSSTAAWRRWRDKYPERVRMIYRVKGHLRRLIPGKLTIKDLAHIRHIQQGHCAYCGRLEQPLTIEHIIPVTREGTSNDPWNICLACPQCNSSKHNKLLEEWTDRWYLRKR